MADGSPRRFGGTDVVVSDEIDPQDLAENFDEDLIGAGGRVLSDEARVEFPPDRLHGVPFSDSDVTDESVADRLAQEEPEDFPDDPEEYPEHTPGPVDPDDLPIDTEEFPDPDEYRPG